MLGGIFVVLTCVGNLEEACKVAVEKGRQEEVMGGDVAMACQHTALQLGPRFQIRPGTPSAQKYRGLP